MKLSYLLPLLLSLFFLQNSFAQANFRVTFNGAIANTTCSDPFGTAPDPVIQVRVDDRFWETYLYEGCSPDFPNTQLDTTYNCLSDITEKTTFQVCLRIFENDPGLTGESQCLITPDDGCTVEVCEDFDIPMPGRTKNYNLTIPNTRPSSGNVNFNVTLEDNFNNPGPTNDLPCGAIDLGDLQLGSTLSTYANPDALNNFCGDNIDDVTSVGINGSSFHNGYGVWHRFKTSNTPSSKVIINAISSETDPIHIQMALYEAVANCNDRPTLIAIASERDDYNERLEMECLDLQANTEYLILIDSYNDADQEPEWFGRFGIEIIDAGSVEAANLRCAPEALGVIPENGSINPPNPFSNFCADAVSDPTPIGFTVEQGVLFTFTTPSSGNININAISDPNGVDPISLEMALFSSSNDNCQGNFSPIASLAAENNPNNNLTVRCLEPNKIYWLLIDGDRDNVDGIFNLSITDLGSEPNMTTLDTTLCSGGRIHVGNNFYNQTGEYTEVVTLPNGCDSTIFLNLVVQDPLEIEATLNTPASDAGAADGQATVTITGGSGNYIIEWSDGQTTTTAENLLGGELYCVTVTDDVGCQEETCILVEFINNIRPSVQGSALDCNGDTNGVILLSATKGEAPYTYVWQNEDDSLNGEGTIANAEDLAQIRDLPAGTYSIMFSDVDESNQDTTVMVIITEPEQLSLSLLQQTDASCFSECDGSLSVEGAGGTGSYQFIWSTGAQTPTVSNLCAGNYTVTITDENGCTITPLSLNIVEPTEFIATAVEIQAVSCFGNTDGRISVTANKPIASTIWSNGASSPNLIDLATGNYEVTITDIDGCTATSSVLLTQPNEPLMVRIELDQSISCNGEADGILRTIVTGPMDGLTFDWSNGSTAAKATELNAGNYAVRVVNANGCSASADFMLEEPNPLTGQVSANIITCLDEFNAGEIYIDAVNGGVLPYEYSIDGIIFTSADTIRNLLDGAYDLLIRDGAGCELTLAVEVQGPPDIIVDLGADIMVGLGEPVVLEAISNSDSPKVSWSIDSTNCVTSDCTNIEVLPLETTTYAVTIFDELTQCSATDEIVVQVSKDRKIYIPTAFSPNLDGRNDQFTIFGGPDVAIINAFRIFNRSGALMYEISEFLPNDTEMGWDGKFNGKAVNSGVYVWMAEITFIDGRKEMYRGDVTVIF